MDKNEFERAFFGELAPKEEADYIKKLALGYLEEERWCIEVSFELHSTASGATVSFRVQFDEGSEIENSTVEIAVGYDDLPEPQYHIVYDGNNSITSLYYPDETGSDSPLVTAHDALAELLEIAIRDYDPNVVEIIKNLHRQVTAAKNPSIINMMRGVLGAAKAIPVADAVRDAVVTYGFDDAEKFRQAIVPLDPSKTGFSGINIIYSVQNGLMDYEDDSFELYIHLSEHQGGSHIYTITDGSAQYRYDDGGVYEVESLLSSPSPDVQEALDDLDTLGEEPLTLRTADYIKQALMSPIMEKFEESIRAQSIVTEFPDMSFGIVEERFLSVDGDPSVTLAAKEVLRAIDTAMRLEVPAGLENNTSDPPSYYYNPNRTKRIRQFLNGKVIINGKVSRSEVADIHHVTQGIVDELSLENHPVSQAVSQLFLDHSSMFGDEFAQMVATEVIVQTHENLIKQLFQDKIDEQRAAHRLTRATLA